MPSQPVPASIGRSFSAPVGLLFNTVRPERAGDFEKVLGYLQNALAKTTDPDLQAQARGWRIYKAAEPGPNDTVLYVFAIDPTVPGADYGLGRILADVYRDPAQLAEIWRLYTGAVTSGGTLLNLQPVAPAAPAPPIPPTAPTLTSPDLLPQPR